MMTNINQTDKLAKLLAGTSPQAEAGDKLYDIDLDVTRVNAGDLQAHFLSILGCEEGTMASNCGCTTAPFTLCC